MWFCLLQLVFIFVVKMAAPVRLFDPTCYWLLIPVASIESKGSFRAIQYCGNGKGPDLTASGLGFLNRERDPYCSWAQWFCRRLPFPQSFLSSHFVFLHRPKHWNNPSLCLCQTPVFHSNQGRKIQSRFLAGTQWRYESTNQKWKRFGEQKEFEWNKTRIRLLQKMDYRSSNMGIKGTPFGEEESGGLGRKQLVDFLPEVSELDRSGWWWRCNERHGGLQ